MRGWGWGQGHKSLVHHSSRPPCSVETKVHKIAWIIRVFSFRQCPAPELVVLQSGHGLHGGFKVVSNCLANGHIYSGWFVFQVSFAPASVQHPFGHSLRCASLIPSGAVLRSRLLGGMGEGSLMQLLFETVAQECPQLITSIGIGHLASNLFIVVGSAHRC